MHVYLLKDFQDGMYLVQESIHNVRSNHSKHERLKMIYQTSKDSELPPVHDDRFDLISPVDLLFHIPHQAEV